MKIEVIEELVYWDGCTVAGVVSLLGENYNFYIHWIDFKPNCGDIQLYTATPLNSGDIQDLLDEKRDINSFISCITTRILEVDWCSREAYWSDMYQVSDFPEMVVPGVFLPKG